METIQINGKMHLEINVFLSTPLELNKRKMKSKNLEKVFYNCVPCLADIFNIYPFTLV